MFPFAKTCPSVHFLTDLSKYDPIVSFKHISGTVPESSCHLMPKHLVAGTLFSDRYHKCKPWPKTLASKERDT